MPDTAFYEMKNIKKQFFKTGGIECFHAIQSFAEKEVTPEQAHEIGIKLAEELWGDRFQVIVSTHLNTDSIHTHFVLNSVKCGIIILQNTVEVQNSLQSKVKKKKE